MDSCVPTAVVRVGSRREPRGLRRHGDGSITPTVAAHSRTLVDAWWTCSDPDPDTGARERGGGRGFVTRTAAGNQLHSLTVAVDNGA